MLIVDNCVHGYNLVYGFTVVANLSMTPAMKQHAELNIRREADNDAFLYDLLTSRVEMSSRVLTQI